MLQSNRSIFNQLVRLIEIHCHSLCNESMRQTYVADIFLAQSWRDHRLRLPENMTSEYRQVNLLFSSTYQCFWRNTLKC